MSEGLTMKIQTKIIYSINFTKEHLIICSKTALTIYSLVTLKIIYTDLGIYWDAIFIPQTQYIAYVKHDSQENSKRKLSIFDFENKKHMASVVLKAQIEQIKTSRNCIAITSRQSLHVLHFPTLKPIFSGTSGTYTHNHFDISELGLTLAHDCAIKGRVIVHNFTNLQINKKKQTNLSELKRVASRITQARLKTAKSFLEIDAHKQNISAIRLCPNGLRLATASNKGTIIRIFLTSTGELWQEMRVSYEWCRIHDINFFYAGNAIVCLNEKNLVQLFNAKLQPMEVMFESQRNGYKIYQQENPKSFFSFLSIFNRNLDNDFCFADFKLIRPLEPQTQQVKEKQKETIPVIFEQEEEMVEQQTKSKEHLEQFVNMKGSQKMQETTKSIRVSQKIEERPRSYSGISRKNSTLNKKKEDGFVPKIYNTVSRVYMGEDNTIWAIKGYYLYVLKYDPFHGGEMYHLAQ